MGNAKLVVLQIADPAIQIIQQSVIVVNQHIT